MANRIQHSDPPPPPSFRGRNTMLSAQFPTSFLRLWPVFAIAGTLLALAVLTLNPGAASGQSGPAVTVVEVSSDAGGDDTYGLGETIRVTLTFSEAVGVTGTPRLKIKMDPDYGEKWAAYDSGSDATSLSFVHEVVQPNISTDGIAVLANTLELNGGTIKSTATEADADLSHDGLGHDADHKVDWQVQNSPATGAPTITGTARVGETLMARTSRISDDDGLTNATFSYQWLADDVDISGATSSAYTPAAANEGKAIKVRVSFTDDAGNDESLSSAATAAVAAALPPPAPTNLVVSDNGNGTLTLTWDAPDDDGVTGYQILRRRPNEGESTLLTHVADTGSTDTTWTDGDVTIGTRHVYRVKAISGAGLSQMSSLARATPASPPENSPAAGAPIITGTAQVGETLTADISDISDGDGLTNATFSYQWLADEAEISGARSSAYTLVDADEGNAITVQVSFTDDAGNEESLTSTATTAVVAATPPDVTGVAVTSAPSADNTYALGETIRVTLTFSEAVDVTGTPRLKIKLDPNYGEKWATYESGSGTTDLTFAQQVVEPNTSTQGIAVLVNTLELNDGAIKSTTTEADADLSHAGLDHDLTHKVDWEHESPPPAKPSGLSLNTEAGSLEVGVDWDDVEGAADYLVRWRLHGPGQNLNEGVRPTSSDTRITVADYGKWVVRVKACSDAGCGPAAAQQVDITEAQPAQQSAGPAYKGQLAEVLVELSLRRPAPAASPGGASVRSEQTPQTTSIVYVVDDSGSMDGDFPEVRAALRLVRGSTMANTKVALIAFGHDPKRVFGLTDHSTDATTGPWTETRIDSFGGRLGGTEYEAPLENAKALLDADDADTKRIILLTDAQSNVLEFITGWHYLVPPDAVKEIKDAGITVDTIGFGEHFSVNFDGLEQIATGTGGEHREVTKPSQGTTNEPSVTEKSIADILKGAVADNTATLFLVDHSASFRRIWKDEWDRDISAVDYDYTLIDEALNAAATKAADASGTGRQVGLATFLGESAYISHPKARSPHPKYKVIHGIGSSSLSMPDPLDLRGGGSTDIDHALQQAYSTLSKVTADNKRVVLITDGISAVDAQDSTLDSYKEEDAPVTLDVVAWSDHADRVQLKAWADSAGGNFSVAKSPPLAPRSYDLRVIYGPESFVLLWADPEDPTITKYQYRQYVPHWAHWVNTPENKRGWPSEWEDMPGTGAGTYSYIFTGLDDLAQYQIQVRAVRGDTPGARSITGYFTPRTYERGMSLKVWSGDGQIELNWGRFPWQDDLEEGKGDFKEYRYSLREDDGPWSDWTTIPGATDDTDSYTITGLTNGTVYTIALLRVLEKDGETHNTAFETKTARPNNFPTGTPIITGTAQVGETLTVDTSGISDADGLDNQDFWYDWFFDDVNGWNSYETGWSLLNHGSSDSYTISAAYEGKTIKVEVLFVDDAGNFHRRLFSGPIGPVEGATSGAAVVTSSPRADNTYGLGETIQVTLGFGEAVDVTGTPRLKIKMDPNYGEKWATYDESLSGTSSLTFTHEVVQPNVSTQGIAVLANTLELNGGTIKFTATEADADLAHAGLAHDANHKVDWQANRSATGAPTICCTARVGETLHASTWDIADANGVDKTDSKTFSYQWLADDADIDGATTSVYTLADADVGKTVKVRVSFTDDAGHAETLTSRATAAVAPESNSAASGQPTISGTARVGVTLTAGTSGIADADGLDNATFIYEWLADDADISYTYGSESSTYTLTAAEEGKAVKVRVTFTDDWGYDETLTSAATAAVAPQP